MFTPGFTRLALLRNSLELIMLRIQAYHLILGSFPTASTHIQSPISGSIPQRVNPLVWADPFSLAATNGISVDFFSCGYLDVSVHRVHSLSSLKQRVCRGYLHGLPHSEIAGSKVVYHLSDAYRRLLRPSSPLAAKASTTYASLLDHIIMNSTLLNF
jgi:hypothetical protein